MRALGQTSWEAFALRLAEPALAWRVRPCLSVTVSRFWRNRAVFECLAKDVLPSLRRTLPEERPLVVWCAGCASGQEAFSVAAAALWSRALPCLVVGSDINWEALRRGLGDRWTPGELRGLPPHIRGVLFEGSADHVISARVRACVLLVRACLFRNPPVRRADVVLCRNSVLTYFSGLARWRALEAAVETLSPGGYLVVGRKERIPEAWAARLGLELAGRGMYRKVPTAASPPGSVSSTP